MPLEKIKQHPVKSELTDAIARLATLDREIKKSAIRFKIFFGITNERKMATEMWKKYHELRFIQRVAVHPTYLFCLIDYFPNIFGDTRKNAYVKLTGEISKADLVSRVLRHVLLEYPGSVPELIDRFSQAFDKMESKVKEIWEPIFNEIEKNNPNKLNNSSELTLMNLMAFAANDPFILLNLNDDADCKRFGEHLKKLYQEREEYNKFNESIKKLNTGWRFDQIKAFFRKVKRKKLNIDENCINLVLKIFLSVIDSIPPETIGTRSSETNINPLETQKEIILDTLLNMPKETLEWFRTCNHEAPSIADRVRQLTENGYDVEDHDYQDPITYERMICPVKVNNISGTTMDFFSFMRSLAASDRFHEITNKETGELEVQYDEHGEKIPLYPANSAPFNVKNVVPDREKMDQMKSDLTKLEEKLQEDSLKNERLKFKSEEVTHLKEEMNQTSCPTSTLSH